MALELGNGRLFRVYPECPTSSFVKIGIYAL
jgi:hypothetical protein